jgi:uncharacterized protein YmfQ (DUF2313 family)
MTSRYSADDYTGAALSLLPRGPIWSADPNSVQGKVMGAIARCLQRCDEAACALLVDAFPATTEQLLPEWEASLGLPDPIVGPGATDDQRRGQILARLVGAGGQSRQRYIAFAALLGFEISIGNYATFRVGVSTVETPIYDSSWTNVWSVHVISNTGGLDVAVLKAELDAIKPAETTIIIV